MPNLQSLEGIVGTDNVQPVFQPTRGFKILKMEEVYLGLLGQGKEVALLEDLVVTTTGGRIDFFVVTDINLATGVPTLTPQIKDGYPTYFEAVDTLIAPGFMPDLYRLYVDKSVNPARIAVDSACFVHAVNARSAKIFLGTDIGEHGTVISRVYDASGNYLTDTLPLELALRPNAVNYSIRSIPTAYTNYNLQAGALVTAAFYSDTGVLISRRQLKVEESTFVHTNASDKRYVVGISLRSNFMSKVNPNLLEFPMNLTVSGLNLYGVVHYSDGSTTEYPVNGVKFSVDGLDEYVSTVPGEVNTFMLSYKLSSDESTIATTNASGDVVVETFMVTTMAPNTALGVKLYAYPQWNAATNGYTLKVYLLTLSRQTHYDVTALVYNILGTPSFDGRGYGAVQHLQLAVNLKDVDSLWPDHIHTQTIDIKLEGPGTLRTTNYLIYNPPGQTPAYGAGVFVKATQSVTGFTWDLDFSMGIVNELAWKALTYNNSRPLYATNVEAGPLEPTHLLIEVGSAMIELSLNEITTPVNLTSTGVGNATQATVYFTRKVGSATLYLSVIGMPIWRAAQDGTWL